MQTTREQNLKVWTELHGGPFAELFNKHVLPHFNPQKAARKNFIVEYAIAAMKKGGVLEKRDVVLGVVRALHCRIKEEKKSSYEYAGESGMGFHYATKVVEDRIKSAYGRAVSFSYDERGKISERLRSIDQMPSGSFGFGRAELG